MVGLNSIVHQISTVAIFAILFVAIQVNSDKGCTYDFEQIIDFDLDCNDLKNSWTISEDTKDSLKKKALLLSEKEGCLKTKSAVALNSTATISIRFLREAQKDDNGKLIMRLVPKEGSCPDEECVWDITADPQYKSGEWITVQHKFPLKSSKEYYVQIQSDNNKGKLFLDRISLPSGLGNGGQCVTNEGLMAAYEAEMNVVVDPHKFVGTGDNSSASRVMVPGYAEIAKNLMLTSASVLTLNNLIN